MQRGRTPPVRGSNPRRCDRHLHQPDRWHVVVRIHSGTFKGDSVNRPCLDCGRVSPGPRCPEHEAAAVSRRENVRGTASQRGYDSAHRARALALKKAAKSYDSPCSICGRGINYDLKYPDPYAFQAHHITSDKAGPLEPSHALCNQRVGRPT